MDVLGEMESAPGDPISQESQPKPAIVPDASDNPTDYLNHCAPGQYTYQPLGIEMMGFSPAHYLDNEVKNMELRDDDIVIAAYPKTGNTWMQEMLWLIMNDADTEYAKTTAINDRVPFLEFFMHGFSGVSLIDDISRDKKNRIFYTHLPMDLVPRQVKEKRVKVVSMLRNPLDTMVSYYYFCKSYKDLGHFKGEWDDFYQLYMSEKVPYGHVVNHNLSWWNARDDLNILFVRYEDLLADPKKEVLRISEFCGVTLTPQKLETIVEATRFDVMKNNPMTNRTIYKEIDQSICAFMRKGVSGDWKNYFSDEQHTLTCEFADSKLKDAGLTYPCME
ncbi:sulfotransferase 1B1-like [Lineus longissimus]|uniref:sulfotransferase 1B1-like n=1 Tax=Lineus longissimus TaxID=88925 RepID=UPI002B4D884F